MKFYTPIQLYSKLEMNQYEIVKGVVENIARNPNDATAIPGVDGQLIYDSVAHILYAHNGTAWVAVGTYTHPNHSGDVTSVGDGAQTIANDAVTNAKLANMTRGTVKVGTATDPTDLNAKTSGYILIGDGTDVVSVAISGDITISAAGAVTIGNNKITLAKMATQAADTVLGNATSGAAVPTAMAVAEQTLLGRKTGGRFGALSVTDAKLAIELNNVTNDAQVKKRASSTLGNIPTWNGTTGDALNDGYTVETTLTGGTGAIPRADAVKTYIDGILGSNDAMIFKGTVGSGGTHTIVAFNALATYGAGWTYRVVEAGTIKGKVCEIGDMLIGLVDRAGSLNVDGDWTVVQTNADGLVTGPTSANADNFASFNAGTGKIIKDSGYSAASFTKRYSVAIGNGALTTVRVNHALNQAFVNVAIRRTGTPYDYVYADVVYVDVNNVDISFTTAPTTGEFTVLVIG